MKRSIPPLCIAIVALVIAVQSSRRRGDEHAQHGPAPSAAAAPASPPCPDKQRTHLFYNKKTARNEAPTQQEIDTLLVLLAKRVEAAEKMSGSGK